MHKKPIPFYGVFVAEVYTKGIDFFMDSIDNRKAKRRFDAPPYFSKEVMNDLGEEFWPYNKVTGPLDSSLMWGKEWRDYIGFMNRGI